MITVDKETCIGCGSCVALCPDTFQLDADGKSEVINQNNIKCAKSAAESCPVQVIKVE